MRSQPWEFIRFDVAPRDHEKLDEHRVVVVERAELGQQ
jgi:hypothetical protein